MSKEQSAVDEIATAGAVVSISSASAAKKGPGRPKKVVEKAPSQEDLLYHSLMAEARQQFVEDHPIVKHNPPSKGHAAVDKLNSVKSQIAREVAVLEFNRMDLEKRGVDTTPISSRIIAALAKISEIELDVKKLGHTVIDPKSTEVQQILKLWLDALSETTSELVNEGAMNTQTLDLLFSKFSDKMEGWEERLGD